MPRYDLDTYLLPVWEGDTVFYETALFVGKTDCAPLLYDIKEVVGVYNYGLDVEYKEGKDYIIKDGKICRVKGGNMPFIPVDEYYLTKPNAQLELKIVNNREVAPRGKTYLAFGEKDTFTKYQIAVTYKHAGKNIPAPIGKSQRFKNFIKKLKEDKSASVVFYGDSITVGCNASGTATGGFTKPNADSFSVMIYKKLQNVYDAKINFRNTAVGGWSSKQGIEAFSERVTNEFSDLMVLGFGMNDALTETKTYAERIENMALSFKEKNPDGEIVLIASMYPNTESNRLGKQEEFREELYKMEEKYPFVAVADMTEMHYNILEMGKRYRDMTGNNVNHPNDFLIRIYAQVILKTILE